MDLPLSLTLVVESLGNKGKDQGWTEPPFVLGLKMLSHNLFKGQEFHVDLPRYVILEKVQTKKTSRITHAPGKDNDS